MGIVGWRVCVRDRQNLKEAQDYCFRLGALICLIHSLRGVDFHPANIVDAGDQPIVIDCETLFHPATALPKYAGAEENSLKRTGFLSLVERERMRLNDVIAGFQAMHRF